MINNKNESWCNWGSLWLVFSYIINDFRIRAQTKHNKLCHVILRLKEDDVWELNCVRQFWEVTIPNRFDDRIWLGNFGMIKITFEIARDDLLRQSRVRVFVAHQGIKMENLFPVYFMCMFSYWITKMTHNNNI